MLDIVLRYGTVPFVALVHEATVLVVLYCP